MTSLITSWPKLLGAECSTLRPSPRTLYEYRVTLAFPYIDKIGMEIRALCSSQAKWDSSLTWIVVIVFFYLHSYNKQSRYKLWSQWIHRPASRMYSGYLNIQTLLSNIIHSNSKCSLLDIRTSSNEHLKYENKTRGHCVPDLLMKWSR